MTNLFVKPISKEKEKKLINELDIKYDELETFKGLQKKKKPELKKQDYTVYSSSEIAKFANKYAKKYADNLVEKYPEVFNLLFKHFRQVEMNFLPRSYIATTLFFTVLSFPLSLIILPMFALFLGKNPLLFLPFSIPIVIITFLGFYFYPGSLISGRNKKIKNDLPFATVHMAAVAGSGAKPISIFELLIQTDEYRELGKEVKKIMNYVNLFGYNLSTALRAVAATTPSRDFQELLNGMVSTIETGGDLKDYLEEKADAALTTYKLERNRYVETLGTYSDVYTAILIAAPLLLVVALAIINSIGGKIGGLDVKTLAFISVFIAMPLLNIGFMTFLSITQPEL